MNPFKLIAKYPYQKRWIEDQSRFKVWNKSRQIGGSFAAAFEIVVDILYNTKGHDWHVLSVSEKAAQEFLEKVVSITNIFHDSMLAEFGSVSFEFHHTKDTMRFVFGERIKTVTCLPANERTVRGFSGNLVCDEVAFWEGGRKLYRAAFPIVTNTMKGVYKLRVISTPNGVMSSDGEENIFYSIVAGDNNFSKHETSIHTAVKEGYEIDIDQTRKDCGDERTFQQEFCCQFLRDNDGLTVIPWEDVQRAIHTPPKITGKLTVGFCDFAAGGDECVFAICRGGRVYPLHCWRSADFQHNAGYFMELFNTYRQTDGLMPENIWCDNGGMGVNFVSYFQNHGYNVNAVNNQETAKNSRYLNVGAEMYYKVAEMLRKGLIALPDGDELLVNQLITRQAVYGSKGKLKLQEKSKLTKSPDRADATVGSIYFYDQLNLTILAESNIYDDNDWEDGDMSMNELADLGVWAG